MRYRVKTNRISSCDNACDTPLPVSMSVSSYRRFMFEVLGKRCLFLVDCYGILSYVIKFNFFFKLNIYFKLIFLNKFFLPSKKIRALRKFMRELSFSDYFIFAWFRREGIIEKSNKNIG